MNDALQRLCGDRGREKGIRDFVATHLVERDVYGWRHAPPIDRWNACQARMNDALQRLCGDRSREKGNRDFVATHRVERDVDG